MLLDFEGSFRNIFTNGNIIGKTIQYHLLGAAQGGQHTLGYISSERLKCQSQDFIVTACTCTGNASPSETPDNQTSIPILNEPRRTEAPSTTRGANDTWCQLLRKINPKGPRD